jgi:hypothetical protein
MSFVFSGCPSLVGGLDEPSVPTPGAPENPGQPPVGDMSYAITIKKSGDNTPLATIIISAKDPGTDKRTVSISPIT